MKVNDYVRTPRGIITKIIDIQEEMMNYFSNGNAVCMETKNYIGDKSVTIGENFKSSPNIIDLIEVGDIIRGKDNHLFEVYAVGSDCVYINNLEEFILVNEIKSIITKELFSQMEYRIGE